ncbi:hypothetical protein FE257_001172 [Aspergillus nanangensis]|uniref:Xylanolytic transcriptional activator regulatory domain-containing protein n=1 Tax=Aspergillus nanangensis TaxID=2582783 RepID=A0AAD4CE86_ASPNN|nr:hypothetical protein FE257_001172 [Aspergillus nanangensis]
MPDPITLQAGVPSRERPDGDISRTKYPQFKPLRTRRFACETTSTPLRKSKRSSNTGDERRRNAHRMQPVLLRASTPAPRSPDTSINVDRSSTSFHGGADARSRLLPEPHRYAQSSAVELTDQLFHIHDQGSEPSPTAHSDTSALPGGPFLSSRIPGNRRREENTSLALHFPGLVLPSRTVCDVLLRSYWKSVQWFMMIFHAPSFEHEYRQILDGQCENMLSHIRSQFFDVLDTGGVECVQLCILLSTYHLYNGKPNLAMPILGAGIRSAQAQGLHKESLWGPATDLVLEVRKRTWWALYVLDRFASIAYGRPALINDAHCAVSMPRDMDDTFTVHPLMSSIADHSAHSHVASTLGTYQRHKFRLYSIAGPIIGNIYDLNASNWEAVMSQATEINTKLVEWFDQLPVELRIERHVGLDTLDLTTAEAEVCQLFQLQALVLQLAYDNIQIVLHRPFVRYTRPLLRSPSWHNSDARPTSFEQCKHCARRTCSILPRYSKVLLAAQSTHAAAYIAIQNFTAGVTLGMVALSDPGSEQSLDAKRGVANSISLQKTLAASSVVSLQTVRVLEGLFRLIFKREMQTLLNDSPLHMNSPSPKISMQFRTDDCHRETHQSTNQLNPHANGSFDQPFGNQDQDSTQLLSRSLGALSVPQVTSGARSVIDPDVGQDVATLPCYPEIDKALEAVQQCLFLLSLTITLLKFVRCSRSAVFPHLKRMDLVLLMKLSTVMWENSDSMTHASSHVLDTTGSQFDLPRQQALAADFIRPNNSFQPTSPTASVADPACQDLYTLDSLIGQSWVWNQTDLF